VLFIDELQEIATRTRRHPVQMLIAQQAHVALVEQDAHRLDVGGAERGYQGAMAAERARHADALLDVRRLRPAAPRVLTNLAASGGAYRGLEAKAARRALDALATVGLVARGSGRGDWSITDPLFIDYLNRTIPSR
jgi:hypothetical protein